MATQTFLLALEEHLQENGGMIFRFYADGTTRIGPEGLVLVPGYVNNPNDVITIGSWCENPSNSQFQSLVSDPGTFFGVYSDTNGSYGQTLETEDYVFPEESSKTVLSRTIISAGSFFYAPGESAGDPAPPEPNPNQIMTGTIFLQRVGANWEYQVAGTNLTTYFPFSSGTCGSTTSDGVIYLTVPVTWGGGSTQRTASMQLNTYASGPGSGGILPENVWPSIRFDPTQIYISFWTPTSGTVDPLDFTTDPFRFPNGVLYEGMLSAFGTV